MKKHSIQHTRGKIQGKLSGRFHGIALAVACVLSWTLTVSAWATPELDRKFALETVAALRAWDNVDGLFSDYVQEAAASYFSKSARFKLVPVGKADEILTKSKFPYAQVILDKDILLQLAKSLRVETVLRTRVYKEGARYRFLMEWIHAPKMDLLASQTFFFDDPEPGKSIPSDALKSSIEKGLEDLVGQLPFFAQVTGRDAEWVTVAVGKQSPVKQGDALVVGTIDDVKRHPLTGQIMEWKISKTGELIVGERDDALAFCKVSEEVEGKKIARLQKVTQILASGKDSALAKDQPEAGQRKTPIEGEDEESQEAKLGVVSANLLLGSYSRDYSSMNGTSGQTGGGLLFGVRTEGQLWLTREFFADLSYSYGFSSFSQQDIATGTPRTGASVNATVTRFLFAAGYTFFMSPNLYGPKGFVRLGYRKTSYTLPASTSESTGPSTYGSLFSGIGVDLPVRERWGALFNFDIALFKSAKTTGFDPGGATGSSDLEFFLGGYYRLNPKMTLRAGIDVMSSNTDFAAGSSVSHKAVSIIPGILFYF